jgi:hypothetical protein
VREPEPDQDTEGGPGVDYFEPQAADTAKLIADTINAALASEQNVRPLSPRLQHANNPPFYFGAWLF